MRRSAVAVFAASLSLLPCANALAQQPHQYDGRSGTYDERDRGPDDYYGRQDRRYDQRDEGRDLSREESYRRDPRYEQGARTYREDERDQSARGDERYRGQERPDQRQRNEIVVPLDRLLGR
jgi:hypothetical protein